MRVWFEEPPVTESLDEKIDDVDGACGLGPFERDAAAGLVLEQLRVISDRITSEGMRPNAVRWHHGQVKTCDRAGLILSSDLTSGARGIVRDACGATLERVAELVRFSVSEPYFQMREAMR